MPDCCLARARFRVRRHRRFPGRGVDIDRLAALLRARRDAVEGFEIATLPAVADAVVGIHLGSMDRIHESWQAVHQEILARGYVPDGPCRENYLRSGSDDQSDWVNELQQPVRSTDSAKATAV